VIARCEKLRKRPRSAAFARTRSDCERRSLPAWRAPRGPDEPRMPSASSGRSKCRHRRRRRRRPRAVRTKRLGATRSLCRVALRSVAQGRLRRQYAPAPQYRRCSYRRRRGRRRVIFRSRLPRDYERWSRYQRSRYALGRRSGSAAEAQNARATRALGTRAWLEKGNSRRASPGR